MKKRYLRLSDTIDNAQIFEILEEYNRCSDKTPMLTFIGVRGRYTVPVADVNELTVSEIFTESLKGNIIK